MKYFALTFLFVFIGCGSGVAVNDPGFIRPDYRIIFVSSTDLDGNLAGASGADDICNNDAAKPNIFNYKALVVDNTRRACTSANCSGGPSEHIDWPLKSNFEYRRLDGTIIGTTNANGLFSGILTNALDTSGVSAFTGLAANWTSGNNCNDWTSNNNGDLVRTGAPNNTAALSVFSLTDSACDNANTRIYCVEQ